MRKYLIAALAAVLSIAVAAVAVAQSGEPTLTTKYSPTKAGTKSKPRGASFTLNAQTHRTDATASEIVISLPKNVRLSGKGFPKCSAATLNGGGSCPAGSMIKPPSGKAHSGSATAVYGPGKIPTSFTVDVYVSGKNALVFYVKGLVSKALNAPITGGKSAQKLTIKIPDDLQTVASNTYAGLTGIDAVLKAKRGKNNLVTTVGCASRKHRTGLTFKFKDNPQYPATGSSNTSDTAPCKK